MLIGDEFFLSLLYPFKHVKDFAITYDNWTYINNLYVKYTKEIKKLESLKKFVEANKLKEIRNKINSNPKSYDVVDETTYEDLKKEKVKSYFWRKFPKNSNIEKYHNLI
jgi:hypothetical protein